MKVGHKKKYLQFNSERKGGAKNEPFCMQYSKVEYLDMGASQECAWEWRTSEVLSAETALLHIVSAYNELSSY